MRKNRTQTFRSFSGWFLPFLLVTHFLLSCSGGVKEGGNLGWTVGIAAGSGQTVLPRRPFKDPVEILLKDSSGNPVGDASVEFRLVESSLLGSEAPTNSDIEKAWNNPAAEMTSSDAAIRIKAISKANESRTAGTNTGESIEDRVGRIDQADTKTDAQGKARAWIIAPSLFEKTIALVAKVGNTGDFEATYSYAFLNTSDVRTGAKLSLNTTNNNVEMAGTEFDIWLSVTDSDGRPAISINGRKKITFNAQPKNSWAGFTSRFPVGDFDCEFAAGRCLVPRGPYLLRVPGEMPVRVTVQDNTISPMETNILVKSDGVKSSLALKNMFGPPSQLTQQIQQLSLAPGAVVELYAAWIDANGNYLMDVTSATWQISSPRLALGMSGTSGASITFAPKQTGTGILNVISDEGQLLSPVPVVVPANEAKSWRFRINNADLPKDSNYKDIPPTLKAGECIELDIYASDAYGNVVPTVKGEISVTLKLENTSTGVVLDRDSNWQSASNAVLDKKIFFYEGMAKSVQTACFRDGTQPEGSKPPQISATSIHPLTTGTLSGQLQVFVQKNVPKRIVLMRATSGTAIFDDSVNVCTRATQRQGGVNPCLILTAKEAEQFRAAAVDDEGNFIKYVKINIDGGNFLTVAPPTETALTSGSQTATASLYTITPTTASPNILTMKISYDEQSGTLTSDDLKTMDTSGLTSISYDYRVVSKEPVVLKTILRDSATNAELIWLTAGRKFQITAQMLDEDNTPVLYRKERVQTWNASQDYDRATPFKPDISQVKAILSSGNSCHLNRSNNPSNVPFVNAPLDNYELDFPISARLPEVTSGEIKLGTEILFVLYRATNASNGSCSVNLSMEAKLEDKSKNWSKTLATQLSNPVSVEPETTIATMRLKSADDNLGDDSNPTNCNRDVNDYRFDACHETLQPSSERNLFATFYDPYGNYISAQNKAVKFTWTNTPGLTSAAVYSSLSQYAPQDMVNYGLTNLGESSGYSFKILASHIADTGKSLGGAGFIEASYIQASGELKATSKVFNFPTDTASSFVIDFLELNPSNPKQPKIYWSSADIDTNRPADRQLEAGREFSIRIRPVNSNKQPVKGYLQLQKLRISIPEPNTWGRFGIKTALATELGTSLGGTNIIDVDCNFSIPTGSYEGIQTSIGSYPLTGTYENGSECVVKKLDGSIRTFQLLSTSEPYLATITDLNPASTITNKQVSFQVQTILSTNSQKKLVAGNKCGGPSAGSALWWESQDNIPFSSRTGRVTEIGSGVSKAYLITADEKLTFYPALVDTYGNFINNIQDVDHNLAKSPSTSLNILNTIPELTSCLKIQFEAETANDTESQAEIITLYKTGDLSIPSIDIPIRVKHGNPAKLSVQLMNAKFSASSSETTPANNNGVTQISAGTCLSPSVRVMDSNGNLVKSFTQYVSINLALNNYYSTSNLDEKEILHPGGIYRYRSSTSVYSPITSLDSHTESETVQKESVDWLTPERYRNPSKMDSGNIDYYSSEKTLRLAENGKIDLLDRYFCLMDATSGLAPNLRAAVTIIDTSTNTSKIVFGESSENQSIQIVPGSNVAADLRLITGNSTTPANERLCYIGNSDFAVVKFVNQVPTLDVQANRACRPLQVSDASVRIGGYFTDKVGNFVSLVAVPAGQPSGSWSVKSPVATNICNIPSTSSDTFVSCSNSTLTIDTMKKTGSLTLTWNNSSSNPSENFFILIKSGPASTFALSPTLDRITTDDDFGLRVTLKDAFNNDFDPPPAFDYRPTATIEYTGAFSATSGTNPPNGDTSITVKKPTEATLQFFESNTASTSGIFGFRKANNGVPGGIRISFSPNSSISTITPMEASITVVAGKAFAQKIFFSNPLEELVPFTSTPNDNLLNASNNSKLIEVRAQDRSGNTADNPAVVFSYVENLSGLGPILAHSSLPNSAWLPLTKTGIVKIQASLSADPNVKTPVYKVEIRSSTASKVRVVRTNASGVALTDTAQSNALSAGDRLNFRLEVTDDQGNIFDQFNEADYNLTWSLGNYPARAEGPRAQLPGCTDPDPSKCPETTTTPLACNFVAGVCKDSAGNVKVFPDVLFFGATGVGSLLQVKAEKTGKSTLLGSHPVTVVSGVFHHFGVTPSKTSVDALADTNSSDPNSKFSVTVEARDLYGNMVSGTGTEAWRSVPITLKIYQDNGSIRANGDIVQPGLAPSTGVYPTFVNLNSIEIGKVSGNQILAYDEAGSFRVFAEGTYDVALPVGNRGKGTNAAAPLIQFNAVIGTVKKFQLVFNGGMTSYTAGQENTLRLEAVDNYGNPVRGLDNVLSAHTYSWTGLSSSGTYNRMSRPSDSVPIQFNTTQSGAFRDGVALFKATFYEAKDYFVRTTTITGGTKSTSEQGLTFTNRMLTPDDATDDRTVEIRTTTTSQDMTLRVVPDALFAYNIIATGNSSTNAASLASNATFDAANSSAGRFRLVVQPVDAFGNLRTGESGLRIAVTKNPSDSLITSSLRRDNDAGFATNFLDLTTGMRAGVGYEFNNLYYRIPQTVSFSLSGAISINVNASVPIAFQAKLGTIEKYALTIASSTGATTITAGVETNIQLQAKDEAGNNLVGSAIAGDRLFNMSGPSSITYGATSYAASFIDANTGPSAPATNKLRFDSSGVANAKVRLYKAELLLTDSFALNDTETGRSGKNSGTLTVAPSSVNEIKPDTITPKVAGESWTISAWAYDQYGNPSNSGCSINASTSVPYLVLKGIDGSGVTNTLQSSGDGGGAATSAFSLLSETRLVQSATSGYFQLTGFKLYRKGENRLRFEGNSRQSDITVAVSEANTANELRLNTSVSTPEASLLSAECLPTGSSGASVSCPPVYALMWDEFGNSWQKSDCAWSYSDLLPSTPISTAGTVSGIDTGSFQRTLNSDKHMNGALRCQLSASQTKSGSVLPRFVNLYGGIAGLGYKTTVSNTEQLNTGLLTTPTDVTSLVAGNDNLKIQSLTLLQYRGGSVTSAGVTTAGTLQAVNRARTESYAFSSTPATGYSSLVLPTALSVNHSSSGDDVKVTSTDPFYSFNLTDPWKGSITLSTRGVSASITGINVSAGAANSIRIGRFTSGGVEKSTFLAGDEITLESIEVKDAAGNYVCTTENNGAATIESSAVVMVPPVCGTDLACSSISATAVGSVPADFSTFALNESGNKKTYSAGTTAGYWSNLKFKLYRASLPFTLRVKACGKNFDTTISVTSATNMAYSRLSTGSRPASDNTALRPDVKCPLSGNGLAVSCPQINAYFWDTYGNAISSETCGTWNIATSASTTGHTFGSGSGQLALPAANTAIATISTPDSKYLSGLLSCTRGSITSEAFVYGGLTSLQTGFNFGGTSGATTAEAAANNLEITSITAQLKKPSLDVNNNNVLIEIALAKDDFNSSSSEVLTFSTDSGTLTDPALPIVSSISFTCQFTSSGTCPSASLPKLSLRKVESGREIRINLRGLTSTLTGSSNNTKLFTAFAAKADATTTTFDLLDSSNNLKTDTNFTADQTFGMNITAKDAFGNVTTRNRADGTSCGTVSWNQSLGNNPLGNSAFTAPTLEPSTPSQLRNMQITKAGSQNVTFSICGVDKTFTFNISAGAANQMFLNRETSASATALESITCSIENGGGTTCPIVYTYFYDTYKNLRTNETCDSWTLTAQKDPNNVAPTTVPWSNLPNNASTVVVTHQKNLDATLKCIKSGAAATTSTGGIKLQGGFSHLKVTATIASKDINGFIAAASDNVHVSKIEALAYVDGVASAATQVTGSQTISFATDASAAPNGTPFTSTTSTACTFANGICTPSSAYNFTFAKADSTARKLIISVMGVNSLLDGNKTDLESIKVKASAPSTLNISSAGGKTAGTEFSPVIEGRDPFGNPTLAGCTDVSMSGAGASPDNRPASFSWNSSGFDSSVNSTFPGAKAILYASGLQTLYFTATGCTNVFGSLNNVPVAPKADKYAILSTSNAATPTEIATWTTSSAGTTLDVACSTLNTNNNGVTCPTLYVYKYDEYGNKTAVTDSDISNQKCLLQGQVQGSSTFSSWPTAAQTSPVHSATRASDNTTPAIDELVQCSDAGLTFNQVRLYGGPAKLDIDTTPASTKSGNVYTLAGSSINAGMGNVSINKFTLRSLKAGQPIAMPGFSGNQTIAISIPATGGLLNNTFGTGAASNASTDVFAGTHSCAFASTAECTTSASMNFKRIEASGKRFTVTLRGISVDVQLPEVKPIEGSSLSVSLTDSSNAALPPAGFNVDSYSSSNFVKATVTLKDTYTNTTTIPPTGVQTCSGLQVSGNFAGVFPDSITYVDTDSSSSTATLRVYKATTHPLSFQKCGLTASQNLTIVAGTTRRTLITQTSTPPSSFNCVPISNSIEDARTCTTSVTCTASDSGTLAGGSKCGTFYSWEYDKAGNRSTIGTSCTTTSSPSYSSTGGAAASSTSSNATVTGGGFSITASESNKHLEGNLACVPSPSSGSLGGTQIALLAPVTVPINVECTPWIYITDGRSLTDSATTGTNKQSSTPFSLCSFKNESSMNLLSPSVSQSQTADSSEAVSTSPWNSWSSQNSIVAGQHYGQFLIQGSKGKRSARFALSAVSESTSKVSLTFPSWLRVPLRKSTTSNFSVVSGQARAVDAGASIYGCQTSCQRVEDYAEISEADDPTAANVSYNTDTIVRRAALAVQGTSTTNPGVPISNWTLDNNTGFKSGNVPLDTFNIIAGLTAYFNFESTFLNPFIWQGSDAFFQPVSSTCVGYKLEQISNVCQAGLKYKSSADYSGLRGVFMLLDANGYFTYHLTEPIP